ncbi:UDP-glucuronosyltransferase [Shivajiella indica]|uniref:UDP-glucuronosyltransferase n=1 Tax=Shivajiella indica TaxID=872115 RepID=A0ABW5BCN7_9BACT
MINYNFRPETYFDGTGSSILLTKLHYPESQWGEEISIYINVIDGKYHYEAIDFYGNDINLSPSKTNDILSLQELIRMIETMEVNAENILGNIELTISGIPEAKSDLYPELEKYFIEKRKSFGLN